VAIVILLMEIKKENIVNRNLKLAKLFKIG